MEVSGSWIPQVILSLNHFSTHGDFGIPILRTPPIWGCSYLKLSLLPDMNWSVASLGVSTCRLPRNCREDFSSQSENWLTASSRRNPHLGRRLFTKRFSVSAFQSTQPAVRPRYSESFGKSLCKDHAELGHRLDVQIP